MNLRKRSASVLGIGLSCDGPEEALSSVDFVRLHGSSMKKIVIFSGSGLSASSGMSMFSTRNGLYERARKQFKISDGIKLFTYSFYKQRKEEVQAFFAEIYSEAQDSKAAAGHYALREIGGMGRIQRHFTLNIDGLAEAVGMDTWHHVDNPKGITVEMHGNIRQLVCPSCHSVEPLSQDNIAALKAKEALRCQKCSEDFLRFKVMLYDDAEGDCITPEGVFDLLEEDLEEADAVLWLGISFEQSASVEYFRRVRHLLGASGRLGKVKQAIVNPSDDAYFNLISSCSNADGLQLMDVRATSDDLLPLLAKAMSNPAFVLESVASVSSGEGLKSGRRLSSRDFRQDYGTLLDSDESEKDEEENSDDDEGFTKKGRGNGKKRTKMQRKSSKQTPARKQSTSEQTNTSLSTRVGNGLNQDPHREQTERGQGQASPTGQEDDASGLFGQLSSAPSLDNRLLEDLINQQRILLQMQQTVPLQIVFEQPSTKERQT